MFRLCVASLIAGLVCLCARAQCTTSYQDQSTDGYVVVAWDSLIDNYTGHVLRLRARMGRQLHSYLQSNNRSEIGERTLRSGFLERKFDVRLRQWI